MMLDVRTSFVTREGEPYVPLNYDLRFHGPVLLREALGSSYNLIAVKVLDAIGLEAMMDLARRLGIHAWTSRPLGPGRDAGRRRGAPARADRRLCRLGQRRDARGPDGHPPRGRRAGQVFSVAPEQRGHGAQALDERVAYLITDILCDDHGAHPRPLARSSVLHLTPTRRCQDRHNHRLSRQLDGGLYT